MDDQGMDQAIDRISKAQDPLLQADREIIRWWNDKASRDPTGLLKKIRIEVISAAISSGDNRDPVMMIHNEETGALAILCAPVDTIGRDHSETVLRSAALSLMLDNGLKWRHWSAMLFQFDHVLLGVTQSTPVTPQSE